MSKKRDYTRFSKPESVSPETVAEPTTETVFIDGRSLTIDDTTMHEHEPTIGVVTDCLKLNVRDEANPTAMIVGTINASTELVVDLAESTDEFYKIITSAGVEGYCMKKFITIMP